MSPYTMRMPDLGEGVVEAEVVEWLVSEGERVTSETPIVEVMTDKASVELEAPVDGVVTRLLASAGDVVIVGSPLLEIERDGAAAAAAAEPGEAAGSPEPAPAPAPAPAPTMRAAPAPAPTSPPRPPSPPPSGDSGTASQGRVSPPTGRPRAAPTVRRRARELHVDLRSVRGSGPGGRILMQDLEQPGHAPPASMRAEDQVQPLRGLRRVIAERMATAWAEIPHITYVDEVDVEAVEALRRSLNDEAALGEHGERRITLLPLIARAMVLACRDQPRFNATYDGEAQALHVHGAMHLGVATQTERGLVVPVVRDADRLGLLALTDAIGEVTQAARVGRLGAAALRGSTITITSLGRLGGIATTPIVNHPEVAVIGVNKIQIRPVWSDGAFAPRAMMNLSSSFDHRIIDGFDAATFVQRIKQLLETPSLMTLGWTR